MSRTKTGVIRRRKHKRILKYTKGFTGANNRLFKRAHEAMLHSGQYAYVGRKLRKRDFRKLWITRIGIALRNIDNKFSYSRFIKNLNTKQIALNRKMLAELAIRDNNTFKKIVDKANSQE